MHHSVQAIRQLASLLRQADQLFTALGEEVVTIQTRTEGLGARVTTLATIADNYDPRKQPIRKWSGDNPRYVESVMISCILLCYCCCCHLVTSILEVPSTQRCREYLSCSALIFLIVRNSNIKYHFLF